MIQLRIIKEKRCLKISSACFIGGAPQGKLRTVDPQHIILGTIVIRDSVTHSVGRGDTDCSFKIRNPDRFRLLTGLFFYFLQNLSRIDILAVGLSRESENSPRHQ